MLAQGRPFDELNACLHRACRDACFELVEKLRARLSPFTFHLSPLTSHLLLLTSHRYSGRLSLETQFCRFERMLLGHGGFCSVKAIKN